MTARPAGRELEGAGTAPDLRRVGAHPHHWYPVAWSHEVKPGKTFAAQFAGEPIALVRPSAGQLFALEDRCAHRQVPLSKGTVEGCTLRCCYHGWRYDASGRCVDVPYLKDKAPNGVRRYAVTERDGVIFVWPGRSPPSDPPVQLGAAANPPTRRGGSAGRSNAITASCTRT